MEKADFLDKINKIKLIVSDVDGILTDATIHIHSDGIESKQFTVHDGAGSATARIAGIPIALLSGRYSEATTIRAREMGIPHCFQGKLNKIEDFVKLCEIYNVSADEVAYIGDGLIDIPVIEKSGIAFSPPNSHPLILEMTDVITKRSGGTGVLQEVVEFILKAQNRFDETIIKMRKEVYKG